MNRSRVLLWLALLLTAAVVLAGVFGPNRQPVQLELFWSWRWDLPLWAVLLVGVAVGSGLGGGLIGVLWLSEWRRRVRHERRANQVQVEVNGLRRLLAQPIPGVPRAREPGDDEGRRPLPPSPDVSGNL